LTKITEKYRVTLQPTTNTTTSGKQRSKSASQVLDFYLDGKQEMQYNNDLLGYHKLIISNYICFTLEKVVFSHIVLKNT